MRRCTELETGPIPNGSSGTRPCRQWFLRRYSEYRDDRLGDDERARMTLHMAECAACRRYDRVIRTGVAVLRDSFEEGSAVPVDWRDAREGSWRLQRDGFSRPAVPGLTAAATLLVIAFNLVSAWRPGAGPRAPEVEIDPVVAAAPLRLIAPGRIDMPPLPHIPHVGRRPYEAGRERLFVEIPRTFPGLQTAAASVVSADPD